MNCLVFPEKGQHSFKNGRKRERERERERESNKGHWWEKQDVGQQEWERRFP
jgi:hypothetical protein